MPENRSEAFEGKFSFKPFKQRPKLRPESIIKRPEKNEPVVKTKEKESSWSRNQVDRFGKRYREEGKLPPVKKVDTSGNSIYKAANMQIPVTPIPEVPKQNRTSRGVEALEGPEALAMVAPKPRGVGVFDRIKNFFTPPEAPTGGVDPSGLMSPSPMAKYKIAIAKDQKKELTNTSEIKIAQTLLTNMGYTPYGIDGKIGNGTRRAVRKLQAQHGLEITGVLSPVVLSLLKSNVVQDFPDKPDNKAVPITFDAKDLSTYSNVISQIESKGKYNIMGGAGKTYVGKYQLGKQALTDLNYGYTDAKIKALLADPDKQEELFKEYTEKNHKELTRISSEYRNMSKEEQLGILGYAHNQGAVGAAEFLFTGVVGSDAFDTEGTEFTKAVIEAFGWTAEGEKFAEENSDVAGPLSKLESWTEVSDVVPSHIKQFADDIFGDDTSNVKTEEFFKPTELTAMRTVIEANITRMGSPDVLKILLEGGDTSSIKLTPQQVEDKLKNLGFAGGDKKSIQSFQRKFGLSPDGVIGPLTTDKLLRMGVAEYKDYKSGTAGVTYGPSNPDPFSLTDKEGAVQKTLGQFNWEIDKDGNLVVTDQYNFNDAEKLKKKYPTKAAKIKYLSFKAAQVAAGRLSPYAWLRQVGGLYGSDTGQGDTFKINLGKI